MIHPILFKLFFVIGMASAVLAIGLVLFSSVFFDKRRKIGNAAKEIQVKKARE